MVNVPGISALLQSINAHSVWRDAGRTLLLLCPLVCSLSAPQGALAQVPETFTNPVIPGDHPDPSIIRVGKTY
jgi:hypothetical protein